MNFDICFLPEEHSQHYSQNPLLRFGRITIGQFNEVFESNLDYWNVEDYQRHWYKAIERIVEGNEKSCLMTSIYEPKRANFLFWWPLYRIGNTVYFQNAMLFLKKLKTPFDPNDPYASIADRVTMSRGNNQTISEWHLPVTALQEFLSK